MFPSFLHCHFAKVYFWCLWKDFGWWCTCALMFVFDGSRRNLIHLFSFLCQNTAPYFKDCSKYKKKKMKNMSFISFSLTETPSLHSCKAQKKAWRSPETASRFSIATRLKLENLQRWAAPPPTSGSVWKFHPKWSVHVIGAWYRSISINILFLDGPVYPV